jgi:hypothetical protein
VVLVVNDLQTSGSIPLGCSYQSLQPGVCQFLVGQLSAHEETQNAGVTLANIINLNRELLAIGQFGLVLETSLKNWLPAEFNPGSEMLQAGFVQVCPLSTFACVSRWSMSYHATSQSDYDFSYVSHVAKPHASEMQATVATGTLTQQH